MTEYFDKNYWQNRYENNQAGWDIGEVATPLKEYFDQLVNREMNILIPGAGNSYEAEYLHRNNFTNVSVLDLALQPLENLKQRIPDFPNKHLFQGDFFEHSHKYDLIVEQTFFCALHPTLRTAYAKKMHELLVQGGTLAGVLFNTEFEGGPPFGGNKTEYLQYFEPFFQIKCLELCYNSIKPRQNRELFVILVNK
ncbi:MAG: SAM-dependent methyltransferase [Bacteroidetes bacterium]|nr:SAM-dependent methyltransferase [Bacteroidota bacterium]